MSFDKGARRHRWAVLSYDGLLTSPSGTMYIQIGVRQSWDVRREVATQTATRGLHFGNTSRPRITFDAADGYSCPCG
jgi:hypothetical protein